MISTKKVLSALMLIAFMSANAQDLFVKKGIFSAYEPAAELNQIVSPKSTVGGYPILNTGQEFKLILAKTNQGTSTTSSITVPLGRVVLFSEKNKKHLVSLEINANLTGGQFSGWIDEPCKRQDFLWKRSISKSMNDENCVSINHVVNYFVNPTGEYQQILARIKNDGIEISSTIIRVTFSRNASSGRRLIYSVDLNPEQYGIDRDVTVPWGSNGWYKEFVSRDPKRVEFLERLKKWATDAQDRIDAAFDKDPRAFDGLRPLDEYLTGVKNSDVLRSNQEPKMEDKLAKFKSLYEKGLLTETQYNEQVKMILSGN